MGYHLLWLSHNSFAWLFLPGSLFLGPLHHLTISAPFLFPYFCSAVPSRFWTCPTHASFLILYLSSNSYCNPLLTLSKQLLSPPPTNAVCFSLRVAMLLLKMKVAPWASHFFWWTNTIHLATWWVGFIHCLYVSLCLSICSWALKFITMQWLDFIIKKEPSQYWSDKNNSNLGGISALSLSAINSHRDISNPFIHSRCRQEIYFGIQLSFPMLKKTKKL